MLAPWLSAVMATTPVQLDWVAPPPCHDASRAREELSLLLGRPPSVDGDLPFAVRVTFDGPREGQWHVSLTFDGPGGHGERTLDGASCVELSQAAELIIALAIDPDAVSRQAAAPAAPIERATTPDPAPTVKHEAPASLSVPVAPSTSVRLHASFITDFGTLPRTAPGAEAGVALRWKRFQARLCASLWPAQRAAGLRPATGADVSLWSVGARAGLVLWKPLDVLVELGPAVGQLRGQGVGLDVVREGAGLWFAAVANASLGVPLTDHLAARAGIETGVTFVAPAFLIDGIGVVHQPASVFARGWIGLEVFF